MNYYQSIRNKLFFLLVCVCMSVSCNEKNENQPILNPVHNVSLSDIGNYKDGRDLGVKFFNSTTIDDITEFRVYILKGDHSSISIESLNNNNNFLSLKPNDRKGRLGANFKDIDGELIMEDVLYKAVVVTKVAEASSLSDVISGTSSAISLDQVTVVSTLATITNAGTGGMDVDKNGNIYMGDFGLTTNGGGDKVLKISPDGYVSNFSSGFNTASGNDFDSKGNLFQSSFNGRFISKITPDGISTRFSSHSLLTGPVGIAIDNDDNLFVADWRSSTILKITKDQEVSVFCKSDLLNGPNGIDIDRENVLYVSNWNNSNIVEISPDGEASLFVNTPGNNAHLLINGPFLYTVGRFQHSIYRITISSKSIFTFFGNGRGDNEGSLSKAQLSFPNDIAFSPDGKRMYINHVQPGPANGATISPAVISVIHFAQ